MAAIFDAVRQVLLDSQLVCMLSDFGMSSALGAGEAGADYAANCAPPPVRSWVHGMCDTATLAHH